MSEKKLQKKISEAISNVTPGVKVSVISKGRKVYDISAGTVYKYYDLASLTKVVCTVSLLVQLQDQKKLSVTDHVRSYIPWFEYDDKIQNLLTHSAGFTWWLPIYQKLDQSLSKIDRGFQLEKILRDQKKENGGKSVYSDIDFFYLKSVLERLTSRPINILFENLAQDLKLKNMQFHVDNIAPYKKELYAPTEHCDWRKKTLQGEVHDENTWALGGVATHAGLFSDICDLEAWSIEIRKALKGESRIFNQKTIKLFTQRALKPEIGDWSLGFMMPTSGKASCGKYFSDRSFGHTGFTGTSIWFDPVKDLIVLILSNRIHPTRNNEEFRKLRPLIHDWVVESLRGDLHV